MSYTPDTTNGQATIVVDNTSTPHVIVTHRVRSAGKHVVWFVFNARTDEEPARVCVTNFRQENEPVPAEAFRFLTHNCVDVASGKTGVLHVQLNGQTGSVYTYDVTVNGSVAVDPELEIESSVR
jgi:hypothetical protein